MPQALDLSLGLPTLLESLNFYEATVREMQNYIPTFPIPANNDGTMWNPILPSDISSASMSWQALAELHQKWTAYYSYLTCQEALANGSLHEKKLRVKTLVAMIKRELRGAGYRQEELTEQVHADLRAIEALREEGAANMRYEYLHATTSGVLQTINMLDRQIQLRGKRLRAETTIPGEQGAASFSR